ncbi:Alpha-2-macroglobulin-like protein 1 [Chelonia mydas]|uniref:Alpha-2-macroglobulin-like protein 1 n=1 Tax=Chelonia mydas TaxID=8469 RepID=M7AWX5_CHEMY|nr:Alpha-2-macroglobulin-like protein 1 [Chelonia mydas]
MIPGAARVDGAAGTPRINDLLVPEPSTQKEAAPRAYFPETWLWDLVPVGEGGSKDVPVSVPDTITEWKAGMFCTAEVGFGLSPTATFTAFKPFFVELALPYSVIRGEAFALKATVFNYLQQCIKVRLTLGESAQFQVQASEDGAYTSCLCADEGKTFQWEVTASSLGEVNFTVSTEALHTEELCGNELAVVPAQGRKDTVIKPLLVQLAQSCRWLSAAEPLCHSRAQSRRMSSSVTPALPPWLTSVAPTWAAHKQPPVCKPHHERLCVTAACLPLSGYTLALANLGYTAGRPQHPQSEIFLQKGEVNFTVSTEALHTEELCGNELAVVPAQGRKDTVIKPLLVQPGGILEEKAHSSLLCQEASEEISLQLPVNVLAGSERAHVTVLGDIMGTALQNIDRLLAMPYGCGEQNMVRFAPNIYIQQYLEKSGQLSPEIRHKAQGFLQSGYQRELLYKHNDGSYSAFGESDAVGNTWLTAFVLKSFGQARPYISIDEKHLEDALGWLQRHQLESGCFRSVGKLFNNALQGGVVDELSLSAYITAGLLELGQPLTDPMMTRALQCLRESSTSDLYTQALLAYAFGLAGSTELRGALLQSLAQHSVSAGTGSPSL